MGHAMRQIILPLRRDQEHTPEYVYVPFSSLRLINSPTIPQAIVTLFKHDY